jgi:hypothetical protein
MQNNKTTLLIAFLILSLIATLGLVFRTTIFFNQATVDNNSPVVMANSYLFASPLQAKADGLEQIRITVFLLDGRGLGVANQKVTLRLPSTIKVSSLESVTDDTGKTYFDISSPSTSKLEIEALIGTTPLPQKVKVVFY